MKRFVLSGFVIASFIIFSLYYRVMGQSTISVVPPNPATPTPVPSNQPTAANTPPPLTSPPGVINTPVPTSTPVPPTPSSGYKDGTFVGTVADAFYGNIQVQVVMQAGKITDVQFLQYPNDRSHSIEINQYAMPILTQEAIQAQSANVDIVSGATDSSQAFIQSLQTALNKSKI